MLYNLNKPNTFEEAELRRNLFWAAYATERIFNAFNALSSGFMDEDCSQILPRTDRSQTYAPVPGRQRIIGHNVLITHPKLVTDSFTLYIKATVILGRVKSFNRSFLYTCSNGDQTTEAFVNLASNSDGMSGGQNKPANAVTTVKPQDTVEFKALDNLIGSFLTSIPADLRDPIGWNTGMKPDPILYMTHMLPHMATIASHDPHANVFSVRDISAQKILSAARAILELIYKICATTYDLLYLDHSSSKAWFIAGVTFIRFLSARTIQNDEAEVACLTQELNAVKLFLGNLGDRTRIGLRQIKLLETVYTMEMAAAKRGGHTHIAQSVALQGIYLLQRFNMRKPAHFE
ncbi:hypothetical protein FRB96_007482 [Tulasnella sp. 330]|nr:hypothetical protein FRB96_007482 [Tulasnella sp. 330]